MDAIKAALHFYGPWSPVGALLAGILTAATIVGLWEILVGWISIFSRLISEPRKAFGGLPVTVSPPPLRFSPVSVNEARGHVTLIKLVIPRIADNATSRIGAG